MNNKLKELAKYCCKPNEQEYEFIKTCAEKGGVEVSGDFTFIDGKTCYVMVSHPSMSRIHLSYKKTALRYSELIPVIDFCNILLKDEKDFEFQPKVGEWCAVDYSNTKATRTFLIESLFGHVARVSKCTYNQKKSPTDCLAISIDIISVRKPTPEEIQTAIDAWDDRVEFKHGLSYYFSDDCKGIEARDGYKFRLSEDCLTAELIKNEK